MLEGLKILLSGGFIIYGICHVATVLSKCYLAKISDTLDKSKVEALAKMMSKDININLHR